jgi:hypothetical protein
MVTLSARSGKRVSRSDTSLEQYAAEQRWLGHCRRWALPVAGMIGALILGVFLWGVATLTEAML